MISSQKEEVLRVLDLVGEHKGNTLNGLFSSINIIAEEEVVLIPGITTILEELDKVRELTMNVT